MDKRVCRVLCLLLICCLLVNISPIKAEASVSGFLFLYGDDIIIALTSIMIGLGIVAPPVWYSATASKMASDIESQVAINPDDVLSVNFGIGFDGGDDEGSLYFKILQRAVGAGGAFIADDVVEWVLQWLVDAAIIQTQEETVYGDGFTLGYADVVAKEYWQALDIYSLFNSGDTGILLVCGYGDSGNRYGAITFDDGIVPGTYSGAMVGVGVDSLSPYVSTNYPIGTLVDNYGTVEGYYETVVFRNYDEAYDYWLVNGTMCYYLMEDTYISDCGYSSYTLCIYLNSLGVISSSGVISSRDEYMVQGGKFNSTSMLHPLLRPLDVSQGIIVVPGDDQISLDHVPDPSLPLTDGYSDWYANSQVQGSVEYLPVILPSDISDSDKITQDDIWTGNDSVLENAPGNNVASTPLDEFVDAITAPFEWLADTLLNGIKSLFVPSAEVMAAQQVKWDTLLGERFGALVQAGSVLGGVIDAFQLGPAQEYIVIPGVTVNFGAVPWTFGPFEVRVVPEGFEFFVVFLKRAISLVCTLLFVDALKRRYERTMEG